MPSAFSITTATNNIPIGTQRSATILFTVTNTSGQPLTGRAVVVMDPPHEAQAAWLQFSPPQKSERPFDINGVQDFTVELNVPVGAAAGEYLFHLDMLVTDNPDETYTVGPTVKLRVTEPEKKEKKPFPWWIIAVAIGVLVVIIGVVIFWPRRIEVPNVIDQSEADARATVTAAGLAFEKAAEIENEKPAGIVIETTPQAGEQVRKATPVFYVLSLGQEPTPTAAFKSGLLTYQQTNSNGTVSIILLQPNQNPVKLVDGVEDAEVLDFTPHNGGVYALLVVQGGRKTVWLVRVDGSQIGAPIDDGWSEVKLDAHWTSEGAFLIIEAALSSTNMSFYYVDSQGTIVSERALP